MRRYLAVGTVAAALLVGPAAAAQAADGRHHNRAQKRAERIHERRLERRAEKSLPAGGGQGTKPAPGATTAPTVTPGRTLGKAPARRGVAPGAVTAVRTADGFVVTNRTDHDVTGVLSIQAQPGPWHDGLCEQGGCHLVSRYPVTLRRGVTVLTFPSRCGWTQYDLKVNGALVKSLHTYHRCAPKPRPPVHKPHPKPPVQTPHKPGSHVDGHPRRGTPQTQLAYTASRYDLGRYVEGSALFLLAGAGLTVAARKRS